MTFLRVVNTVQDVFSNGVTSVHEEDSLSTCLSLLQEETPPVVAVVNSEGKYKGVLARRWIIRSNLDPSTTKVASLMRPAPQVALDNSLSQVARLMIESGIQQLPVFSGEELLGFVTDENIIHGAVLETLGNTHVEKIMTKNPFLIGDDESLGSAISLFRDQDISHLPVVRDGKLVGMISVHDIIEHIYQPRQRQTRGERIGETIPVLGASVKSIMSRPVITVVPTNTLQSAAEKMHQFDISSLVVVRRGRAIGIVTKRDFLEPMAQMEQEERRLTVQFSVKDDVGLDEMQQNFIIADFDSFTQRFEETLGVGTLFVYMKTHGSNYSGRQLFHCRLQLRTGKGSFFTSSEGWNIEETFRLALDKLEKQILRSTELEYDQKYARTYLRRLRFPQADL